LLCPECGAKNLPHATVCAGCDEALPRDEDDAPDPLIGRVLGEKYELEAIIGEGSMGCVYAATQHPIEKEVAVKVLHQHVAADPKVAKRFHREARAASRLSHPNSLQIFDFGREDDGTLYIAMELLDGPDLLEVIDEESPLTPRRIVDIISQTLLALEEAHDVGVIHRDLKPENIMVVEDHQGQERVKVCDFGIAKLVEAEGSAITVTGFVCGTPEYMAPEQARGDELDARADLYGIGCVLYQLITGEPPFKAASALGTITKHLTEKAVRPRDKVPERHVPRALERVTMKAIAKNRDNRYPDAAAMRLALRDALEEIEEIADDPLGTHERDPSALPEAKPAEGRWLVPVALVAGGAGLVFAALAFGGERAPEVLDPVANPPVAEADVRGADPPNEVSAGSAGDPDPAGGPDPASDPDPAGDPDPASDSEPGAPDPGASNAGAPNAGAPNAGAPNAGAPNAGAPNAGAPAPRSEGDRDPTAGSGAMTAGMSPSMTSARTATAMTAPTAMTTTAMTATAMTATTAMSPAASEVMTSPGRAAFDEGRRAFLANDVPGAIAAYRRASGLMPGNAQVHKQLGRAYMRAGDVPRAQSAYRRYLELAPNAPDRAMIEAILR